jgi:hypothetical protein
MPCRNISVPDFSHRPGVAHIVERCDPYVQYAVQGRLEGNVRPVGADANHTSLRVGEKTTARDQFGRVVQGEAPIAAIRWERSSGAATGNTARSNQWEKFSFNGIACLPFPKPRLFVGHASIALPRLCLLRQDRFRHMID